MADIQTNAQLCANAVSTKAFARRHPYPPAKSEAPQTNTAETEHATGANCASWDTNDEGNTKNQSHPVHGLPSMNGLRLRQPEAL